MIARINNHLLSINHQIDDSATELLHYYTVSLNTKVIKHISSTEIIDEEQYIRDIPFYATEEYITKYFNSIT